MKIICWLFLGTLAFGQALGAQSKIVNCHGPVDVFPEIKGHSFPVKCGKKVTVLEQGQDWSRIRADKQEGYIATYFLTKSKKQRPPINWQPAIDGLKGGSKIAEDVPKQQPVHFPLCYNGGHGEAPGQIVYDPNYGWSVTW